MAEIKTSKEKSEKYNDNVFSIIKKPVSTEKMMMLIEEKNIICFEVEKNVTKLDIKKAVEDYFKVKVENINTYMTPKGKKRAYVKLNKEYIAMDIATQLGLM